MGKHELFSCSTGSQNVISILHTSFHRSLSHSFVRCRCGNIPEATAWLKVLLALLHSFDDACLVSCIHATTRSISILKCSVCSGAYQRHGNRIVIELLHGSPASQNLCPELSALSNLPCSTAQPASVDCHERLLPRQTLRPRGSRSVTGTGCFLQVHGSLGGGKLLRRGRESLLVANLPAQPLENCIETKAPCRFCASSSGEWSCQTARNEPRTLRSLLGTRL